MTELEVMRSLEGALTKTYLNRFALVALLGFGAVLFLEAYEARRGVSVVSRVVKVAVITASLGAFAGLFWLAR